MATLLYFLLFAGLFLLMMRSGCGSHVMGHGHHGHRGSGGHDHGEDRPGSVVTPESAVDPVCGMTVRTAEAKSTMHQGRAYYFCSSACRDKFETSPAEYTQGAATAPAPMEHQHGTAR